MTRPVSRCSLSPRRSACNARVVGCVRRTGKGSPYVGEVLDTAFGEAQAVVVLLLRTRPPTYGRNTRTPRARREPIRASPPNALFEAGMAIGRDSDRTILVELGATRPLSDLAGRFTVRPNNEEPARQDLVNRLANTGCNVDRTGGWETTGNCEVPGNEEVRAGPPLADSMRCWSTTPTVSRPASNRPGNDDRAARGGPPAPVARGSCSPGPAGLRRCRPFAARHL